MLNSGNMDASQFGWAPKGPWARLTPGMALRLARRVVLPILIAGFALSFTASAQQLDQDSSSTASDCTDPAAAASSACQQNQVGSGLSLQTQRFPGMTVGDSSSQPRTPGTYSDVESLARQRVQQPIVTRPELLTEFQKFVASTTRQILPIYGMSLFRNVPSTFAPLDLTPVPASYVIGPGDELRIRVWGQVSFQSNLRVDRSGDIFIPHVGPVHVAGVRDSDLDSHLRAAVARVYRNFDLTVDVGQIRSIQVYLSGQARRPGVYTVSSLSTLIDALFAAGGPSVQGSLRHIELRREGSLVTILDLYGLLTKGDKSKDVPLANGDVIFIPPVGPQAAITGSVRSPAIYELRPDESLADLIADAGGATAVAAAARMTIERIEDHRERHAMDITYDQSGLSTKLADGDLVRLFSIVPSYQKTVTLRGNTANPGRFAWHPGMRVSELIPDKESLITRNYWWKRAELGLPSPEFEPNLSLSTLRQSTELRNVPRPGETAPRMNLINPQTGLPYPQPATPTQQQGVTGVSQDQTGFAQDQLDDQQNPDSPDYQGAYIQQQNAAVPGQQPANAQDQTQQGQTSRASSATLASQEANPLKKFGPGTQRTQVRILAPEIDWSYAAIERLDPSTLKTTVVSFDLGKLVLNHDVAQDMELQPGDVVTIFSEADIRLPLAQQTKLVTLEGEFTHGGTYSVRPGETLRQLVERAGGFTNNAYLFGSEFSRESVRVIQQARIDEYIQSLQAEMERGTLAAASTQDVASATAAQSTEQDLISRLRQVHATGRIVLEFHPDTAGLSAIPDLQLEDGDKFVVPSLPANINVVGAVSDQNSFLYNRNRRAGAYLKLAGGPNRNADHRHAFIIRADGEVVSNSNEKSGPWGANFEKLRIYPGDTIVVPDKVFKPSALRGFLDWSQVFSQLAFGAAAINVIR